MKAVNIGVLRNQLSAYLQLVRNGEEVVVRDRKRPIARILPYRQQDAQDISEEEAQLVAAGVLKLPENPEPMDWDAFWALPRPTVSHEAVKEAVRWAKSDSVSRKFGG